MQFRRACLTSIRFVYQLLIFHQISKCGQKHLSVLTGYLRVNWAKCRITIHPYCIFRQRQCRSSRHGVARYKKINFSIVITQCIGNHFDKYRPGFPWCACIGANSYFLRLACFRVASACSRSLRMPAARLRSSSTVRFLTAIVSDCDEVSS